MSFLFLAVLPPTSHLPAFGLYINKSHTAGVLLRLYSFTHSVLAVWYVHTGEYNYSLLTYCSLTFQLRLCHRYQMSIWIISNFWKLQIMLMWRILCKSCGTNVFPFLKMLAKSYFLIFYFLLTKWKLWVIFI